ncbi:hypothetical protein [Quadrisphaera setariae]|uniref:Uncharacterized protein n=1 Tax=Quadrisphaera setariae TaxID=2593304 RepID=A0A5C8ZBG1_9ACTN|nr:hypothetical protein [Quadrisphaera setariae]TXR55097.1 hypothetical protein FMM08_16570 [Quadrisphaera setariae]
MRDAGSAYDRAAERLRSSTVPPGSDDAGARARDNAAAVQLAAARLASAQAALTQARAAAAERQAQHQAQRQAEDVRPAAAERAEGAPQGRLDTYL